MQLSSEIGKKQIPELANDHDVRTNVLAWQQCFCTSPMHSQIRPFDNRISESRRTVILSPEVGVGQCYTLALPIQDRSERVNNHIRSQIRILKYTYVATTSSIYNGECSNPPSFASFKKSPKSHFISVLVNTYCRL